MSDFHPFIYETHGWSATFSLQPTSRQVALHAISAGEEPASSRDVCAALEKCAHAQWLSKDSQAMPLGHLILSHAELGDAGLERVLETLCKYKLGHLGRDAERFEDEEDPQEKPGYQRTRRAYIRLRTLRIDNNSLTDKILDPLASYLQNNVDLLHLDLSGNDLVMKPDCCSKLLRALGTSNLKTIQLNSNSFSARNLAALLDNLYAPALREIHLNATLDDYDTEEAAKAIARLLRSSARGDFDVAKPVPNISDSADGSSQQRQGGWAPRLETISVRGDPFSLSEFQEMVLAVVGAGDLSGQVEAQLTEPHRQLRSFASEGMISDAHWPPGPPGPRRERARPGTHYLLLRRQRDPPFERSDTFRRSHTDVMLLLEDQLIANNNLLRAVHTRSLRLLTVARVLGCRSSEDKCSGEGSFQFARLPSELRLAILKATVASDDAALSSAQINAVIQWACDPSTIGFDGGASFFLAHPGATPSPYLQESLIPVPPIDWSALQTRRGPWPKDYLACHVDESPLTPPWVTAFLDATRTLLPDNTPLPEHFVAPEFYWRPYHRPDTYR
ncbi:hypothetical protein CBOM_04726 [Ceraceosorus bombacis]|uniref:Uncharacterized protein n=1 Tax=Ceraceosorus bombacis TaxID=401625 RepID=A0A0P1BPZ4_9BASI|nr:hypothetical protein CBOM_04726 [Ceraceosorus bombacis]